MAFFTPNNRISDSHVVLLELERESFVFRYHEETRVELLRLLGGIAADESNPLTFDAAARIAQNIRDNETLVEPVDGMQAYHPLRV